MATRVQTCAEMIRARQRRLNQGQENSPFIKFVRWVLVIPAAIVAGWLAFVVGGAINAYGILIYYGGNSGETVKLLADFAAHVYLGGAAVYVGAWVAPNRNMTAAVTICCLFLIVSTVGVWGLVVGATTVHLVDGFTSLLGVLFGAITITVHISSKGRP